MQNPHDLKDGFAHAEKNHMFPFRRNLAVVKMIPDATFALTALSNSGANEMFTAGSCKDCQRSSNWKPGNPTFYVDKQCLSGYSEIMEIRDALNRELIEHGRLAAGVR